METECMNALDVYFANIGKLETLPWSRQKGLFLRLKANPMDESLIRQIAEANLRLVVDVAKKFWVAGMDLEDLIQEGNRGLLEAIPLFNVSLGYTFSTYAVRWIEKRIKNALTDHTHSQMPNVSRNGVKDILKMNRIAQELEASLSRLPSHRELAEKLNWKEDKVRRLSQVLPLCSLQEQLEDGEDERTLEDVVASPEPRPDWLAALHLDYEVALEQIDALPPRERIIVYLSFGIGDQPCFSVREIAAQLKLSDERIRQLLKLSLQTLRNRLRPCA